MDIAKYNASIKSFLIDEDFRKDKSPHKYVILWSSKFYRLINVVMRNNPIEEVLKSTKYARRYIIKMVRYFFKYGLYKEDIIKRSPYLYRGTDKDFKLSTEYVEKGFMSTSISLLVAQNFAGKNGGNIIVFNTKKLPKSTPFVSIAEKEILFLPGKISLKHRHL
jgi:hypothetical protein